MHGDKRFRALSKPQPNGQSLWQYLITGPHTSDGLPGLFPVGRRALAEKLGWTIADFDRCWREVSTNGIDTMLAMAVSDWDAHVVWVPNSVRYNIPESPNVCKGWLKPFDLIPESDLRQCWVMHTRQELAKLEKPKHVKAFEDTFKEALSKGFPKGFPKGFGAPIGNTHTQTQTQPQEVSPAQLPLEPEAGPAPTAFPVIMMPVKEGEEPITTKDLEHWIELYGNIDVMATLKKMRGHWASKAKSHRKTRRGIRTSINTWLAKDSDKGGIPRRNLQVRHSNRDQNEKTMRDSMEVET